MYRHCIYNLHVEKDAQFAFRVETPLREQFVRLCKRMDRPAGQVLREFMRQFVQEHGQAPLFDEADFNQETDVGS